MLLMGLYLPSETILVWSLLCEGRRRARNKAGAGLVKDQTTLPWLFQVASDLGR